MSHADDRKDRSEEVPTPEVTEKQPLGFEQEVAPADPSLTGRRLFLKLALFGAAASMLPAAVQAVIKGETASPVELPYRNSLSFREQPGTLSDGNGAESIYLVTGRGDLYIDAAGSIFLSNIQATGTYASGSLDVGTISAVQPMATMSGKYAGSKVDASTTVLYSDREVKQQPATMRIAGSLAKGSGDLSLMLDFDRVGAQQPHIYIGIGWKKATC